MIDNPETIKQRLRGQYATGPHLPNGEPEFGFRQFDAPPIQHDAADMIERLETALTNLVDASDPAYGRRGSNDETVARYRAIELLKQLRPAQPTN